MFGRNSPARPEIIDRAKAVIDQFHGKRVLVAGDLMVDQYIYGETVRLSREAPVPVLHAQRVDYEVGGAANVARYLQLLGAEVNLCGIVGFDDAADHLQRRLNAMGIDTGGIFRSSHRPTILKVRHIAMPYSQQLLRVDHESDEPLQADEVASLTGFVRAFGSDADVVLIADYDKRIFKRDLVSKVILSEGKRRGVPIIVDTKTHHFRMFPGVDLIIAHFKDALQQVRATREQVEATPAAVGQAIMESMNVPALVLNSDEKGLELLRQNHPAYHVGGEPGDVYNFLGSGDVLSATIALCLGSGADPVLAAELGWLAESVVLNTVGTGAVTGDDILHYLDSFNKEST